MGRLRTTLDDLSRRSLDSRLSNLISFGCSCIRVKEDPEMLKMFDYKP